MARTTFLVLAWLAIGSGGGPLGPGELGSGGPELHPPAGPAAPLQCEEPIAWRIAGIDERFGLDPEDARTAVREAIGLWERAAGRTLFEHDPEDGFPIEFVWDSRHQVMRDRLARESELVERADVIREQRREINHLTERLQYQRAAYDDRLEALRARQVEHRRQIEYWEARGGPPPAEARELDRVTEELERERLRLEDRAEALNELVEEVNVRTDALNEAIAQYNQAQEELREGGDHWALSGFYREARRELGSWVLSVEREIQIYQFDDFDHLLRAIAHELGHAMGLGYTSEPSAIMYHHARSARAGTRGRAGAQLHPADLELLEARCGVPSGD